MRRPRKPPKDPLDHDPKAVTLARRNARLTKTEVARRCGVSLSLISEIEAGTRNATPEKLVLLAQALGCTVEDLERKPAEMAGR
jgi:transcriptional regulator with XRE-family HTH domain